MRLQKCILRLNDTDNGGTNANTWFTGEFLDFATRKKKFLTMEGKVREGVLEPGDEKYKTELKLNKV